MIRLLAPPAKLPVLTDAVTCVIAPDILLAPGIELVAPDAPLITVATAFCAPGNPLNPVELLPGNSAPTVLTVFCRTLLAFTEVDIPVVTAFVTLSNPLIADDAAPDAMLAASIPEFDAADFNTPATSLASVPDDCTSSVALSAICFKFCGTPGVSVGKPLVIAAYADPAIPFALSNIPDSPAVAPFVNPDNEVAIELNPPVLDSARLAAKLPEVIDPVTLPINPLTVLPTTAPTSDIPFPKLPDVVFIKLSVLDSPAVAVAVIIPATAPDDSLPVITPDCVS